MEKINEFLEKLPSLDEIQILNDETMEQTEGGVCGSECVLAKNACQSGCIVLMQTTSSATTAPPTEPSKPTPPPTPPPLLPTTPTTPTTT